MGALGGLGGTHTRVGVTITSLCPSLLPAPVLRLETLQDPLQLGGDPTAGTPEVTPLASGGSWSPSVGSPLQAGEYSYIPAHPENQGPP